MSVMNLCNKCAKMMDVGIRRNGGEIIRQVTGKDTKVTCEKCGRRRYGTVFIIRERQTQSTN